MRKEKPLRSAEPIRCIALACAVASVFGLTACGSKVRTHTTPRGTASAVVLRDFVLKPSGILFGMHPTDSRIIVNAAAAASVKVCQFGTTFSTYWKGGCRRLVGRPTALPTSGGAVHVGFRVLPSNARPTRVFALRLHWHCVDHYFSVLRGKSVVRSPSPVFDC
jgi:hypothetical protein